MKEKAPAEAITASRQHLVAKPSTSNENSAVPTPCPSTTDLHLSGSVWADDEGSALIPNPGEGQEDLLTPEVVVTGHLPRNV